MPTTTPTVVINARIDVRVLVRLAEALRREGVHIDSRGSLIRGSLEVLYDIFRQNNLCKDHNLLSTEQAIAQLAKLGIGNVLGPRNLKKIATTISLEQGIAEEQVDSHSTSEEDLALITIGQAMSESRNLTRKEYDSLPKSMQEALNPDLLPDS